MPDTLVENAATKSVDAMPVEFILRRATRTDGVCGLAHMQSLWSYDERCSSDDMICDLETFIG